MAEALWCEPDRAKWVGVRPGLYGNKIQKCMHANDETIIVYTVPAGKTFLLQTFCSRFIMGASNSGDNQVIKAGSILLYTLGYVYTTDPAGTYIQQLSGNPIMELDAGSWFSIQVNGASNYSSLSIFGYEVDNALMGN